VRSPRRGRSRVGNPPPPVRCVLDLARQIKEGAQATCSSRPRRNGSTRSRHSTGTPGYRIDWSSSRGKTSGSVDLKQLEKPLLGNEQVPAGKYAKAALGEAGSARPREDDLRRQRSRRPNESLPGRLPGRHRLRDRCGRGPRRARGLHVPRGQPPKILYSVGRLNTVGGSVCESAQRNRRASKSPRSAVSSSFHSSTSIVFRVRSPSGRPVFQRT
jgi:hypothetical protein